MRSTSFVSLDLQRPNFATVFAVQNDISSRWVTATIRDGSSIWEPPSGVLIAIRYRRSDGVAGFYDELEDGTTAYTINADNTVTFGLAGAALEVAGAGQAEINFYTAQGEKLTTAAFALQVLPSAYDDNEIITSEPYINVLQQQIADVLEAAGDITGLTATTTTLSAGSDATVTVTGGTGGTPYNFAFGIPRGPQGIPGPTGPTGNNYPVGSVYMTINSAFSPGDTFGGTWKRLKDAYLYAAGDDDTVDGNNTAGTGSETVDFSNGMAHIGFGDSYAQKIYMMRSDLTPGTFTAGNKAPDSGTLQWTGASSEVVQGAQITGSQTLDIEPTRWNLYVWLRTA